MGIEIRGGGNATRQIHDMLPPRFPAQRLIVVEVFTPAGNWSSFPPHKHDVHNPPGEVDLEEIYYYRIERPEGFALQKVYTADRRIDETLTVRDGEIVQFHRYLAAGTGAAELNSTPNHGQPRILFAPGAAYPRVIDVYKRQERRRAR